MTSNGHRAILGVEWTADGALVRVRDEGRESALIPALGLHLNYRADAESRRWCVGHRVAGSGYVDCATVLTEPGRTCARCSAAEAIFASQLHHAHTQPRRVHSDIDRHLTQTNMVYLAAFRDGSVKVGTSTASRSAVRLLEQGAWMARYVIEATDGYAVREVEDQITAELGLQQAVMGPRKLAGLLAPLPDGRLETMLDQHARQVEALCDERAASRLVPVNRAWINPAADSESEPWGDVIRYPLKMASGRHDLRVMGMVGRMAAAARSGSDDVFAVDLQKLFGVELELGDFVPDEIAIQDSLF